MKPLDKRGWSHIIGSEINVDLVVKYTNISHFDFQVLKWRCMVNTLSNYKYKKVYKEINKNPDIHEDFQTPT